MEPCLETSRVAFPQNATRRARPRGAVFPGGGFGTIHGTLSLQPTAYSLPPLRLPSCLTDLLGSCSQAGTRSRMRTSSMQNAIPQTSGRMACRTSLGQAPALAGKPKLLEAAPSSHGRIPATESRAGCRRQGRLDQASQLPHRPALLCDSPAGRRLRYPNSAGTAGPQRPENDHDLHPGAQARPCGSPESCRRSLKQSRGDYADPHHTP